MYNNQTIFNNSDKAELFGEKLASIFKPYEDDIFDNNHKHYIENFIYSPQLFNYDSEEKYEIIFSIFELDQAIKQLK